MGIRPLSGLFVLLLAVSSARAAAPPVWRTDLYGDPLPTGAVARLGTVRWRAPEIVTSLAFVPGGEYLATSDGSDLSLWDRRTGLLARTLPGGREPDYEGFARYVTFTPDGTRIVSSAHGPSGNLYAQMYRKPPTPRLLLRELPSGKLLARSPDLVNEPVCLAVRRDGRMAACGTHMGDIVLWDTSTNALRHVVRGRCRAHLNAMAFTADGEQLVVVAHEGGELRQLDVASGRLLRWARLGPVGRHAVAADGTVATYTHPGRVHMHDPITGSAWRLPLPGKLHFPELSFGAGGRTLVIADGLNERAWLWDVRQRQLIRRLSLPGLQQASSELTGVVLSEDGKSLAAVAGQNVIRHWDAVSGRPLWSSQAPVRAPRGLAFSPDGREVVAFTLDELGAEVCRWEGATGRLLAKVETERSGRRADAWENVWLLSPGGRHLAEGSGRSVRVFDTYTGRRTDLSGTDFSRGCWAFTADGRGLMTGSPGRLRLWDVTTGELLRTTEVGKKGGELSWVCLSPDGRTVASGEGWRKVHLCQAATGKHLASLPLPARREPAQDPMESWATAFSPDGRYLFTSAASNLWVRDLVAGKEVGPFEKADGGSTGATGSLSVSADGRLLAWFDEHWNLRIHEVATGGIVHRFKGKYSAVAFAPSGGRMATGCHADGSVLIWDTCAFVASPAPEGGKP